MSKKQILVVAGIIVTPLLLWFLWSNWSSGYYATTMTSIFFPYAALEMFVEKQLEPPDSLGAPTFLGIFLACVQFPIYGWLVGKALTVKKMKSLVLWVVAGHFGICAIMLSIYLRGKM